MKKYITVLFTAFVVGGSFLASDASALTIAPPILEIGANPGDNPTQNIKIFNETDSWITLWVSTANFTAKADEEGTPEFLPYQEGDNSLANWIDIDKTTPITLLPSEQKTIPYTIHVPQDADPGGHYAAIFFGTQPQDTTGSSVGLSSKLGALVLLTVSGNINESGSLLEFKLTDPKPFYDHLPVGLSLVFQNSGNVHLRPQGQITVTNIFGQVSDKISVNKDEDGGKNILPGTSRHLDAVWTRGALEVKDDGFLDKLNNEIGNFALGKYKASLELGYGTQGKTVNANLVFWVFPWQLILVLFLTAAVLMFLAIRTIRGYNSWIVKRALKKMGSNGQAH